MTDSEIIKRQKEEIERLQKVQADYAKAVLDEFAERLKEEKFKINYCGSVYNVVDVDEIDNIKKEMVCEE